MGINTREELYKKFSDLYDTLDKKQRTLLFGDMISAKGRTLDGVKDILESYED